MKTIRYYNGQLDPTRDIPVNPVSQSLGIRQFVALSPQEQNAVISRNQSLSGDHGVANPDPNYIPPFCRKGVTVTELITLYRDTDTRIKDGCRSHSRDVEFRKRLQGVPAAPAAVSAT